MDVDMLGRAAVHIICHFKTNVGQISFIVYGVTDTNAEDRST